jgi:tetrahydromethanopterin S-methyltransferase subunit G
VKHSNDASELKNAIVDANRLTKDIDKIAPKLEKVKRRLDFVLKEKSLTVWHIRHQLTL